MASTLRRKTVPSLELLEGRVALATSAPPAIVPILPAPVNHTLVVLTELSKAYLSHYGQPNYNPAFDLNHNGQIGQTDAKLVLDSLPPLSPKIPLKIYVAIAPQDRAGVGRHHPANSGGVTYSQDPTIIGRTTPGALLFTGTGTLDAKVRGPVVIADAQGNFSLKLKQSDGINQFDLLAVDPYGQTTFFAFPVLWLGFAKYEAAHPRND